MSCVLIIVAGPNCSEVATGNGSVTPWTSAPAILGATVALIHGLPCATPLCSQQGNVVLRMLGALPSLVTYNPPPHLSEDVGSHTFQNLLPESPPSLFQAQSPVPVPPPPPRPHQFTLPVRRFPPSTGLPLSCPAVHTACRATWGLFLLISLLQPCLPRPWATGSS